MPLNVGSAVLVTGETFAKKAALSSLGGSWCKPLSGWIFPEEKRDAVVAALGDDATSGPSPAMPVAAASKDANATLTIGPYKRSILIQGDTKSVKEQLSALGGSWNKTLKGWIFQPTKKAEVLGLLRADPTNTVTEGEVAAPAAGEKRARDDFVVDDDEAVESDE